MGSSHAPCRPAVRAPTAVLTAPHCRPGHATTTTPTCAGRPALRSATFCSSVSKSVMRGSAAAEGEGNQGMSRRPAWLPLLPSRHSPSGSISPVNAPPAPSTTLQLPKQSNSLSDRPAAAWAPCPNASSLPTAHGPSKLLATSRPPTIKIAVDDFAAIIVIVHRQQRAARDEILDLSRECSLAGARRARQAHLSRQAAERRPWQRRHVSGRLHAARHAARASVMAQTALLAQGHSTAAAAAAPAAVAAGSGASHGAAARQRAVFSRRQHTPLWCPCCAASGAGWRG